MNEPEWIISKSDGGGWEDVTDVSKALTPVSIEQFRNFINAGISMIRQYAPGKFVTTGVSFPFIGLVNEFNFDYLALHYYPWMGDIEKNLLLAPKSKPCILEEFPGNGDVPSYFKKAFQLGGAGAMIWNLSPGIDSESYSFAQEEEKLLEVRGFVDSITGIDSDGDGIPDQWDDCPDTPKGVRVISNGCPFKYIRGDFDGNGRLGLEDSIGILQVLTMN